MFIEGVSMSEPATTGSGGSSATGGEEIRTRPSTVDEGDRRLPFTARVAVEWMDTADLPGPEDGQLAYWLRAPMTGNVVATADGRDVGFSDLEVT